MYRLFKWILDFWVAVFIILLIAPLFGLLLIFVIFKSNSPFFTQARIGKNNRAFKLYKLKTMSDATDDKGKLLPDAQRMTSWGSFLRKTSIDELPQLINVIKGDMSLVGPRPLLPQYLPLYSERQAKRHLVKPGITGWAQVNGRNAISWEEKFERDVFYVENQSFLLDIKILWLTVLNVINRTGISGEDTVTMQPFRGGNKES